MATSTPSPLSRSAVGPARTFHRDEHYIYCTSTVGVYTTDGVAITLPTADIKGRALLAIEVVTPLNVVETTSAARVHWTDAGVHVLDAGVHATDTKVHFEAAETQVANAVVDVTTAVTAFSASRVHLDNAAAILSSADLVAASVDYVVAETALATIPALITARNWPALEAACDAIHTGLDAVHDHMEAADVALTEADLGLAGDDFDAAGIDFGNAADDFATLALTAASTHLIDACVHLADTAVHLEAVSLAGGGGAELILMGNDLTTAGLDIDKAADHLIVIATDLDGAGPDLDSWADDLELAQVDIDNAADDMVAGAGGTALIAAAVHISDAHDDIVLAAVHVAADQFVDGAADLAAAETDLAAALVDWATAVSQVDGRVEQFLSDAYDGLVVLHAQVGSLADEFAVADFNGVADAAALIDTATDTFRDAIAALGTGDEFFAWNADTTAPKLIATVLDTGAQVADTTDLSGVSVILKFVYAG